MADAKITALTENTTPATGDLLAIVDDPGGSPATQKVTLANIKAMGMLNSKVITATRDMTAGAGNVSYTGVGFTPTSIIAFATIDASTKPVSWGFVDSSLTEKNLAFGNTGGTYYASLDTLVYLVPTDGNNQRATVASFDADGFTLTWAKSGSPTGTGNMQFLCFR